MIALRRIACGLLLALTCAGCGVKGPVVKKGAALPVAPAEASVRQQGSDLLLSWTLPLTNQDGSALADLERFVISRLAYRPGDYCAECRDTDSNPIQIYLDRPAPAVRVENRFVLRDPGLSADSGYRYRIVPVNRKGEAGNGALVRHEMLPAPPTPTGLQAVARDRSLQLAWSLAPLAPEQGELLGVNLYRAGANLPFGLQPINSKPVTDGRYEDFGLSNDQRYFYRLRSVALVDGQQVESDWSELVEATPHADF